MTPSNADIESISSIILVSILTIFVIYQIRKKNKAYLIRCPHCKNVMSLWQRNFVNVEEMQRGELYYKEVSEEVGYSETSTGGITFNTSSNDNSFYSGDSTTTHYAYVKRPHQMIQFRYLYNCSKCERKIGVRKWEERQIADS